MKKLTLTNENLETNVLVSTDFIDIYMPLANGEYVKIYLYLLRALSDPTMRLSTNDMADLFDLTEKDILRGLAYWEKVGLLSLEYEGDQLSKIAFCDPKKDARKKASSPAESIREKASQTGKTQETTSQTKKAQEATSQIEKVRENTSLVDGTDKTTPAPAGAASVATSLDAGKKEEKPFISPEELDTLFTDDGFSELLSLASYYLKKVISAKEREQLGYCYLLFQRQSEIIEYLLEYCMEQGHTAFSYMEKVAVNWHQSGFQTLEEIKAAAVSRSKNVFRVMRAFGLQQRNPSDKEADLIQTWSRKFSLDLILLACEKTMNAIHTPSFQYADSILKAWAKQNVHTKADVEKLDQLHKQKGTTTTKAPKTQTAFHNFEQRDTDYDSLVANYYGYK